MSRIWPVLLALTGPGVAQALLARRRTAIAFVMLFTVALGLLGFTIYALPLALGVWVASFIDTLIFVVRKPVRSLDRTLDAAICWIALAVIAGVTRMLVTEAFKFPSSSMVPTLEVGDHIFVSKLGSSSRGDVIVFEHPCGPVRYVGRIVALGGDTVELRCRALFINGKPVPTKLVTARETYKDRHEADGEWFERNASRYRETLGENTYDILDSPDRPEQEAQPDWKDFPQDSAPDCRAQGTDLMGARETTQQPGTIVDTKPPDAPCEPHRHFVVPAGHAFMLGDSRANSNDSRFWGAVPVENIEGRAIGIWLPIKRFGPVD